jgi:hypothetical protein
MPTGFKGRSTPLGPCVEQRTGKPKMLRALLPVIILLAIADLGAAALVARVAGSVDPVSGSPSAPDKAAG